MNPFGMGHQRRFMLEHFFASSTGKQFVFGMFGMYMFVQRGYVFHCQGTDLTFHHRPMLSLLHCRLSLLTTKLEEIRRDIVSRIEERQHIVDIVKSDLSNSDLYDVTNNLPTMKDAIVADEMYIATLSKKLSTIT